jgi:putative oxidoreductase
MKIAQILSWTLRLAIAAIFLQTLYFKFTAHPDSVYIFSALKVEPWGRITLGVLELLVSIFLLSSKTFLMGIVASFVIILGAIGSHFLVIGFCIAHDGGQLFALAIVVLLADVALFFIHKKDIIHNTHKVLSIIKHNNGLIRSLKQLLANS